MPDLPPETSPDSTFVLVILDGWGHRDPAVDNAISLAATPTWDRLLAERPHTLISGSGPDVGLPAGQMGNSEVGHMNIGTGRVVDQDFTRIGKAIDDGSFFDNRVMRDALTDTVAAGGAVHLFGLLSPGGVHSHEDHLLAAAKLAHDAGASRIYLHAFLDGRDVPPRSAGPSIDRAETCLAGLAGPGDTCGIASLAGRYWAMDRDNRWERVAPVYDMLTRGRADHVATSPAAALAAAYERDETDEFVAPTLVREDGVISDGDCVLFMNFRADRARELSRAFVEPGFAEFERARTPALTRFVSLTEYSADIPTTVAWPPSSMANSLGEVIATLGKNQLRLAETEKYAHVTFFFSGGREAPFDGEERILIPSPDVATYDLQPEMSAHAVTDELVAAITGGRYALIVCNYANGDMVGHTGVLPAAIKAVETVDAALARIVDAVESAGGQCLVTADHGNVEQMADTGTGQPHTAHTSEPVPLVYIGSRPIALAAAGGVLSDIAPTILDLLDIDQPEEMTGHSLSEPAVQAASGVTGA